MTANATLAQPANTIAAACAKSLTGEALMDAALHALGATPATLSPAQQVELERLGYLLLPGHMSPDMLARMRAAHDRLMAMKYCDAGGCPDAVAGDYWHHESGTRRLANLTSADPVFDATYTDPLVLAAAAQLFTRPFKLDSINAREALPGRGQQALHRDGQPTAQGQEPGVNTAWLLDDFTRESGPTRVIPGSHRWPTGPEVLINTMEPHPQEQPIIAPAGSVFIFANTLWHSGTRNLGSRGRRVVHVSFRPREADLGERAQHLHIGKALWDRMSPAARYIAAV